MTKLVACLFLAVLFTVIMSAAAIFFSTVWGLSPIFIMLGVNLCFITLCAIFLLFFYKEG